MSSLKSNYNTRYHICELLTQNYGSNGCIICLRNLRAYTEKLGEKKFNLILTAKL